MKALLKHQTFVINNLRVKMLIEMNVLAFKDIDLIISTRSDYIDSCRIKFKLVVTSLERLICWNLLRKMNIKESPFQQRFNLLI